MKVFYYRIAFIRVSPARASFDKRPVQNHLSFLSEVSSLSFNMDIVSLTLYAFHLLGRLR